jgi:hypothetical protein
MLPSVKDRGKLVPVKVIMLFPFGFKLDEIPVTLEIEKLMS